MPLDATPLYVAVQESREVEAGSIHHIKTLTLWALVDSEVGTEERTFGVFGTGHPVPDEGYIGSAMMDELVWHVFKKPAD